MVTLIEKRCEGKLKAVGVLRQGERGVANWDIT
jgi:hypothetical protein